MPFLSVIIPIYNVEKYLNQCVESVLKQNLENIEIILVDDGSPDKCPIICDEFAKKYECVRVIHKKNGGLSSARNAGIREAKGQYIIFMDSDDWWNPEVSVEKMLQTVKEHLEVEMFLFTSYDFVEGEGFFKRNEHENLKKIRTDSIEHYYQDLLNNGNLEVSACTKILKKEFLQNNDLYFREGLLSEDNHWMLSLLRCLEKVFVIDEPLYMCRTNRSDSITHTIKRKNIEDLLLIIKESIDYYEHDMCNKLKQLELCYASYLWFSALGLSSKLSKEDKKLVKNKFERTKNVCEYSNSKKTRLCNYLMKIVGVNITMGILGLYIKLKQSRNVNRSLLKNVRN